MNLKTASIAFLIILTGISGWAQVNEKEVTQMLLQAKDGQSIDIPIKVMISEAITISDVKNVQIIGSSTAELNTFNNIPHILKFKNCKDISIKDIKMRYGVKNMGGPILILENCHNVLLDGLKLGNFGNNAIQIDTSSTAIKIYNSEIINCHESGMKIQTPKVELRNNTFSNNSAIGRFKPDLDIDTEDAYPIVRYNSYRVSDYLKHKTTVDEYVESRNSISYNFDCFKIVKKYELTDGSEGKITAFYEGENNKILDKMQSEYKGPKGQITATVYFLHGNAVYTRYEIKKGKVDINYLVYGDFLDYLEASNAKSAAHVAGTPESNKIQYDKWLNVMESWKMYINDTVEEFSLYEKKDSFIPLPY